MEGCRRSKISARCNGLPPDEGLVTKVTGSDALVTGYPDRKDVPQGHTDEAPTPSRTSPDGGATKTAGMRAEVENDQGRIPRARVPVGMVHHPAGTSRATGQALADKFFGTSLPQPDPRPVILGPDPRTVAALPERRMQREKTPNEAPEGAT